MAIDVHTKENLLSVFRTPEARDVVVAAIDQGIAPAASVAAIPASTNLTAAVVTATTIADSNFTAVNAVEPTKAEIDIGINTLRTAVVSALDVKSDNVDLELLRTETEARLDVIESKVNDLLASLKAIGMMLP